MTQSEQRSARAWTGGAGVWDRMPAGLRVALLAAALGCSALAYRDHLLGDVLPWWRWIVELIAGGLLFALGLRNESRPVEHPIRRWGRRACGVVCLIATAVAIHLFSELGNELITGVTLSIALVAFVLARWVPFAPADVRALIGDPTEVSAHRPRFTPIRVTLAVAGVAAGVAAAAVNPSHHVAAFVLWLASLVLFAAACWQRNAALPAAGWTEQAGPQCSRRTEALLLALILLLALTFRITFVADVPAVIDPDEGRQGRQAEHIWADGFPDAFDIGWNVFPNLSYMVEYGWVLILGTSNAHLRLAAATVGVLSLVPAFFWARRWWGNVVALIGIFLLAVNWEHAHWSRVALNNIQQVLVAGLMLAAFARLLRMQRWIDWVWFGYATGLAFHTYHAAKLFPALLAAASVLFAVGIRGFVRRYLDGAVVGVLAFLLCFGPLMVTIYHKWEQFYASTSNRSDLARLTDAYARGDAREVRNYVSSHVLGCLYSFMSTPSRPAATFDAFAAVPFLLGVVWMVWYWRDPRHLVVLIWTAGILSIGGMITDYPPWKARLLGYLPAVAMIPAVVVGRIRSVLFEWSAKRADFIVTPLLVLWLTGSVYQNWDTLFVYWPARQRGDYMTEMCRIINETRLPATFYLARGGEGVELKVAINDCMIGPDPDRFLVNLPDDPAIVPIRPSNHGAAVLFVTPYQQELVPLIEHYYPAAQHQEIRRLNGELTMHVFRLNEDEISHARGLRATYQSQNRTWSTDVGASAFVPPPGVGFPISATWQGQVWLPTPGAYGFRAVGAALRLDDQPIADEEPRTLAAGWHPIRLSTTFADAAHQVALEWKPPGTPEWAAVPRTILQTHPQTHGLLGRYFGRAIETSEPKPISMAPDYARVETALSFDYLPPWDDTPPPAFAASPSTMEWTGTVELPTEEGQAIRLEATTPTQVFIDGALVLATTGQRDRERVDAYLPALKGRVPLLVRSVRPATDGGTFWKLRLLWQEPGGAWSAFAAYQPNGGG